MNTNQDMMKQVGFWAAIIIGIGAVVAGMIWLVSLQTNRPATTGTLTIENKIESTDWVRGNRNASVTLIKYSDFECPACAAYAPLAHQISDEYSDRLAFVYRHFPLPQHINAKPMAYAAEAAGMQGKFWEMHDKIFENQSAWAGKADIKPMITEYARTLGLNVDKFIADYESSELRSRTNDVFSQNLDTGINSTPTFFINGKQIANPRSYEEFKAVIDQALAEAGAGGNTDANIATTTTAMPAGPAPAVRY